MSRLVTFWGKFRWCETLKCIVSRTAPHRKVLGEKYDRARKSPKTIKLKAISHAFRRPRDPCTECIGMPRGDIGWYIKDFHDFERA